MTIRRDTQQKPLVYKLQVAPKAVKPEGLTDAELEKSLPELLPYLDNPHWQRLPVEQNAICVKAKGDGNCAFNSFVLGLRHLVKTNQFHFERLNKQTFDQLCEVLATHSLFLCITPQDLQNYVLNANTEQQLQELQITFAPALRAVAVARYHQEAATRIEKSTTAIAQDTVEIISATSNTDGKNHHSTGPELLMPLARAFGIHLQCFTQTGTLGNDSYTSLDDATNISEYVKQLEKDEPAIALLHSGAHWDTLIPENAESMWPEADPVMTHMTRVEEILANIVNQRVDTLLSALDTLEQDNKNPLSNDLISKLWHAYDLTAKIPADLDEAKTTLVAHVINQETSCCEMIQQQLRNDAKLLGTLSDQQLHDMVTTAQQAAIELFSFATLNAADLVAKTPNPNMLFAATAKKQNQLLKKSNAPSNSRACLAN